MNDAVRGALAEHAEHIAAFEERIAESLISYDEMVKRLKRDGRITILSTEGAIIREATLEGLAKLRGSDLNVLEGKVISVKVSLSPDEPPVCKLAIANALRVNPRAVANKER